MLKKISVYFLLICFAGILSGGVISAEEPQALSVEDQLSEIIKSQKEVEKRLSLIEAKQSGILYALQAMSTASAPRVPAGPPPEDQNKVYKIDVGRSSVSGNKNAKVTIVEFSDFQCPYSQRFHPVVAEVLKEYPKDVNYMLKNFPLSFHPQARPAAKASLAAAAQGKYWEMVELLFQNGRELSDEKFKELAGKIGLDVEKFMKDYQEKDQDWEKLIAEDMTVAESADVNGTPTFLVNGKKTRARDLAAFKMEIDNILKGNKEAKKEK